MMTPDQMRIGYQDREPVLLPREALHIIIYEELKKFSDFFGVDVPFLMAVAKEMSQRNPDEQVVISEVIDIGLPSSPHPLHQNNVVPLLVTCEDFLEQATTTYLVQQSFSHKGPAPYSFGYICLALTSGEIDEGHCIHFRLLDDFTMQVYFGRNWNKSVIMSRSTHNFKKTKSSDECRQNLLPIITQRIQAGETYWKFAI
jgi:hypothetical protein